ncbi:MAG TPA: SLC13 family permease [Alphaproteobacteria bacterium]
MPSFVLAVFALCYVGMALGRLPGFKVDRTGIAMIAAVVLVAAGAEPVERLADAVHFPTLLLLGGLMIVSARFGAAGIYEAASAWIARQAGRPIRLLAFTVAIGGAMSAFLVNDIVVFAMTPLLCAGIARRGLDPRPFLFGLAAASNAGSAATLIGNPQNILIGQAGGLDFWAYLAVAAPPAVLALTVSFGAVALVWREALARQPAAAPVERAPVDRGQATLCGIALVGLLALFATPMPREIAALLVAAVLVVSRTLSSRMFFEEIDWPLLILFAALFVVNDALAATGLADRAVAWLAAEGVLPDRAAMLAPVALVLSNTIGNVPAVVMILKLWPGIAEGTLVGLAILSTLAGNLFLVGSLANLIVAERAASAGVRLSFRDHAKAGVPLTLVSMAAAVAWLVAAGQMRL